MKEILKNLEELSFYAYEDPILVPIFQLLQLNNNSVWLTQARYKKLDITLPPEANKLMSNGMDEGAEFLYLHEFSPPHRCFFIDIEDLYECPPIIFEDDYLLKSLKRYGIIIEDVEQYEDYEGNLHLISNVGDFLICPVEFRTVTRKRLEWRIVTARILLMLNTVLSQAGSDEKFYVLREESDEVISVTLLGLSIFNFFHATKELENRCLPKPIEKYFAF